MMKKYLDEIKSLKIFMVFLLLCSGFFIAATNVDIINRIMMLVNSVLLIMLALQQLKAIVLLEHKKYLLEELDKIRANKNSRIKIVEKYLEPLKHYSNDDIQN